MKWEQYVAYGLAVVLIGCMLFGDYQFFFAKKPIAPDPVTNNYFAANATQSNQQVTNEEGREQHWITGGSCGKNGCEVNVSYLW